MICKLNPWIVSLPLQLTMLSTPIENYIPDLPSPIPELVESFRKLVLDVSGDAATLSATNEELKKVSNKSSVSLFSDNEYSDSASIKEEENSPGDPEVEASPENLTGLVCHVKFISSPEIEQIVSQTDLDGLFTQNQPNGKYIWLTNYQTEYRFGRKTYHPHNFDLCYGVKSILDKINNKHGLELNSFLLVRYSSDNTAFSLHQDNEEILDESHHIVIASVGTARTQNPRVN